MRKTTKILLAVLTLVIGATIAVYATNSEMFQGKLKYYIETDGGGENPCGFFNDFNVKDPWGDVIPSGGPEYVDIRLVDISQIGQYVQFIWEGDGPLEYKDGQYYYLLFDTDFNPNTGQHWGEIGAEIKIIIVKEGTIVYFDAAGSVINEDFDIPVTFEGNTFNFKIERDKLNFDTANFYFETSGNTPYKDLGRTEKITLEPAQANIKFTFGTDKKVLKANPSLAAVEKNEQLQLIPILVKGNEKTVVPQNKVTYQITHPNNDPRIGDPSEIVSIDGNGIARYNLRPGYVFINASYDECSLSADPENPLIIATGSVYVNKTTKDPVIAVFPKDYATRESGENTFGEMMEEYPDAMRTWNLAYNITRQMYKGFMPFDGDKQIFSMMVSIEEPGNPFACHPMNPLMSDPTCYIHSDGSPEYSIPIHEMGHNFHESKGMLQLRQANNFKMNRPMECIASLPVIYMYVDFTENSEKYEIDRSSYEYNYFKNKLEADVPTILPALNDFENQIRNEQISGYFDESGTFDPVAVFCDFFRVYAYDLLGDNVPNPYKQEVIPRFLGIFSDRELPNFIDEKSETYFSATYSAAVGYDMREKLKFWGFTIDDSYFDEIYPLLKNELRE